MVVRYVMELGYFFSIYQSNLYIYYSAVSLINLPSHTTEAMRFKGDIAENIYYMRVVVGERNQLIPINNLPSNV